MDKTMGNGITGTMDKGMGWVLDMAELGRRRAIERRVIGLIGNWLL